MTVFRSCARFAYLSSYSPVASNTLNEIARFDQFGLWSHHQAASPATAPFNTCAVLVADSEATPPTNASTCSTSRSRIHCASGAPAVASGAQGRPPLGPLLGRSKEPCPAARQTHRPRRPPRPSALRAGRARRVACRSSCPCSTNANAVSTPHLNRSATAVTGIAELLALRRHRGPGAPATAAGTASASGSAAPVAGGHRWKKKPPSRERRHPGGAHARCRRRSHYRCPLDAPHHCRRSLLNWPLSASRSAQDRAPASSAPRLPAARQSQARSAGSGPDRDKQIPAHRRPGLRFAERGLPIISIDTKKRELVGNWNHGTTWERSPHAVNDHDFRSQADGMPSPTASTTCPPTAAAWSSAPPTTPPTSPLTTCCAGGRPKDASTTAPANCWCSPTPAAATLRAFAASSMPSRLASSTRIASRSPSVTTPAGASKCRSIIAW